MKKNKLLFTLLLFMLFSIFRNVLIAQDISARINLPPSGKLTFDDLYYFLNLNNLGQETYVVTIQGTVNVSGTGELIFKGIASPMDLLPGNTQITPENVDDVEIIYVDSEYEEIVLQTGSLPSGSYLVCIELINPQTKEIITKNCIDHEVMLQSMPQLMFPEDGSVILNELPMFSWLPPMPPIPDQMLYYQLKMVEVYEGQVPYEAMESNPAWFLEENQTGTSMIYLLDANSIEPMKTYAWQVQAFEENGLAIGENEGKSEIFTFTKEDIFNDTALSTDLWNDPWVICEIGEYTSITRESVCIILAEEYKKSPICEEDEYTSFAPSFESDSLPFEIEEQQPIIKRLFGFEEEASYLTSFHLVNIETGLVEESNIDSIGDDGYDFSFEISDPGFYSLHTDVHYGANEIISDVDYFYKGPSKGISSKKKIELVGNIKDKRNEINGKKKQAKKKAKEAESNERDAGYFRWNRYEHLCEIDRWLEGVQNAQNQRIQRLLDLYNRFSVELVKIDDDEITKELEDYENKLNLCREQLEALKLEFQEKQNRLAELEKNQLTYLSNIRALYRNAGYNPATGSWRDSRDSFHYTFCMLVRNGQSYEKVKGIPVQIWTEVNNEEHAIRLAENEARQLRDDIPDLESEIKAKEIECEGDEENKLKAQDLQTQKDLSQHRLDVLCEEIRGRIEKIRLRVYDTNIESDRELKNDLQELNALNRELNEVIEKFKKVCVYEVGLEDYWVNWNNILDKKKALENKYGALADKYFDKSEELEEEASKLWDKIRKLEGKIEDEIRAAHDKEDVEQKKRCVCCEQFLANQNISKEQIEHFKEFYDLIEKIDLYHKHIIDPGSSTASEIMKLDDVLSGLQSNLSVLMTKMDRINSAFGTTLNIYESLNSMKKIIDSANDTATFENRKKQFIASLEIMDNILDEVSNKIPILKGLTLYFGVIVKSAGAMLNLDISNYSSVNNSYVFESFEKKYKVQLNNMFNMDCKSLISKYCEKNSFDDLIREMDVKFFAETLSEEKKAEYKVRFNNRLIECCIIELNSCND